MPAGVLLAASTTITDTASASGGPYNDQRLSFVMGDGKRLAIYGPANGSGPMHYKTSADGITWSSAASVPATTGAIYVESITQNSDLLYLWTADSGSPWDIHATTLSYSAGTLTAGTTFSAVAHAGATQIDATWDSSHGVLHTALAYANTAVLLPYVPGSAIALGSTIRFASIAGTPHVVGAVNYAAGGTTTILVLTNTGSSGLFLDPITYNGSLYTLGGGENPAGLVDGAACSLNGTTLDVLFVSSGKLYATKRTGTNVYSPAANIAGSVGSGIISLVPSGADLVCLYQSVAGQSNGEIYLAWRLSGNWALAQNFAGGDSGGYSIPKAAGYLTSGRIDAIYQASGGVYYGSGHSSNAPGTPTGIQPSGNETSLTPTITGTYVNSAAPSDLMGAVEYQVIRVSDSFVMWDSGKITASSIAQVYATGSNTGDVNYVAPTSLSYGIQYSIKIRTWDTLSGPPVAGPYSSGTLFTPVQGGTVTITNIVDDGTTFTVSPSTIDSPVITSTDIGWSQPQTHAASQYRRRIYANDGVTLIADEGAQTITLASGASTTLGSWSPSLANSTAYKFQVDLLDGTTALWSSSAQWTLNTAWAPPAAPSSFTALVVQHPGYIVLSWTNPGAAVSVLVERSLSGAGDWVTLSTDLRTTLTDYAPLDAWDYRVSIFDSTGIQSGYATASAEIGADGIFGVSLVDTTNTDVWCWFGPVNDWKQASSFDEPSDVQSTSPFGASKLTKSRRFLDYSASKQREFAVPSDGPYYHGGDDFFQRAAIQTFRAMGKAGNAVWYRDINGDAFYVSVENVQRSIGQDGEPMRRLQWDMDEVNGPGGPANPRMPFVR